MAKVSQKESHPYGEHTRGKKSLRLCHIVAATVETANGAGDGAYGLHDVAGSPEEIGHAIAQELAALDMMQGSSMLIEKGHDLCLNIRIKFWGLKKETVATNDSTFEKPVDPLRDYSETPVERTEQKPQTSPSLSLTRITAAEFGSLQERTRVGVQYLIFVEDHWLCLADDAAIYVLPSKSVKNESQMPPVE
jgi:hypothetical protein